MQGRKIYLIRHGELRDGPLTPLGEAQAIFAAERFLKDWDRKSVIVNHSPIERARSSAALFTRRTSIQSKEDALLHIMTFHKLDSQAAFAEKFTKCQAANIVIIGHDENRLHLAILAMRLFGYSPKTVEIPLGGVLCLDGNKRNQLL